MATRKAGETGGRAQHQRPAEPPGAAAPGEAGGRGQPQAAGDRDWSVRVRMYRQGLGDCFLLTFQVDGGSRHVLVDFGTLGTKGSVTMDAVAQDIVATTGGRLDLLVVTHQHQDHLSGFPKLARHPDFKKADRVWLAWTEDPDDSLAAQLAKQKLAMGTALIGAVRGLRAAGTDTSGATADFVEGLLGFFGHSFGGARSNAQEIFQAAVTASMDTVRTLGATIEYRRPGEPALQPDWLPGFRIYVLGPPRDIDEIHDTGEKGNSQLYGLAALSPASMRFIAGADAATDVDLQCPFDQRYQIEEDDPRIQKVYRDTYYAADQAWRRVDADWLGVASDLALKLDKFTNNTSLVLAIERVSDGKTLLFPGDAQQGNWLSWHDPKIKWDMKEADGTVKTVTARDLLARTVFYKVGHHSSHNATARAKGLELMNSPELVAFIPVDRQVALKRNPPGSWKMPARQLYARLLEKCQGRVMRSDAEWATQVKTRKAGDVEAEYAGVGSDDNWQQWKQAQDGARNIHIDPSGVYIDYYLA